MSIGIVCSSLIPFCRVFDREEIAPIGTDMQLRLHLTSNHRPSTAFIPPAKLSETDIESIAKAVGGIAQLTASIGKFLEVVDADIEAMNKEREHCDNEIQNMKQAC